MQSTNTLRTPAKYLSCKDLCQAPGEIQSCGAVEFARLTSVPANASPRIARSVYFFNTDCGSDYSLLGADRLFQIDDSEVVVAVVAQRARLIPPDDGSSVELDCGIWAFVMKTTEVGSARPDIVYRF